MAKPARSSKIKQGEDLRPVIFIGAILSLGAAAWAQPAIANGGVLNGASFAKGQAVAAGSLVSIFGANLSTTTASASSVPLSTSLGGVSVTFNNIPSPLIFVSHSAANGDSTLRSRTNWLVHPLPK